MNPKKTITITVDRDGTPTPTEVTMLCCLAAEVGFTNDTGKSISIFLPTQSEDTDDNGKPIILPPTATDYDYLHLILAMIVAVTEEENERLHTQTPTVVNSGDLLYRISREDTMLLVSTAAEMLFEWLKIPTDIKPDMKPDGKGGKQKNAKPPMTSTKKS